MGGKGTVTPLLKGKVRIPPPAGHFIDPPCVKKKIIEPFVTRKCRYSGGAASTKRWCGIDKTVVCRFFLGGGLKIFKKSFWKLRVISFGGKVKRSWVKGLSFFVVEQSKFWVSFFSSHIYCTVAARPCCTNFELNYLFGGSKNVQKQLPSANDVFLTQLFKRKWSALLTRMTPSPIKKGFCKKKNSPSAKKCKHEEILKVISIFAT